MLYYFYYLGDNCGARIKRTRHLVSPRKHAGNKHAIFELPRLTGNSYLQYRITGTVDYELSVNIVLYTTDSDGELRSVLNIGRSCLLCERNSKVNHSFFTAPQIIQAFYFHWAEENFSYHFSSCFI